MLIKLTDETQLLSLLDVAIGTLIALIMGVLFIKAGGLPLVVTFIPGLVVSVFVMFYMFINKVKLPNASHFVPLFFIALGWQFLHFNEEFLTEFYEKFPVLYGGEPYSVQKFVSINMASYFVFTVSCILIYTKQLRFLILPVLFYIIYGAIGNAIAHTWWAIWLKGYFPGFYTGLVYWFLGIIVLGSLIGSKKTACQAVAIFAAILTPIITFTMV